MSAFVKSLALASWLAVPGVALAVASPSAASAFSHPVTGVLGETVSADPRQGAAMIRDMEQHRKTIASAQTAPGFATAPLPDDELEGPKAAQDNSAYVRPDFFKTQVGQIDDAAAGDHANGHRRGSGGTSGGVDLAVPLSQ